MYNTKFTGSRTCTKSHFLEKVNVTNFTYDTSLYCGKTEIPIECPLCALKQKLNKKIRKINELYLLVDQVKNRVDEHKVKEILKLIDDVEGILKLPTSINVELLNNHPPLDYIAYKKLNKIRSILSIFKGSFCRNSKKKVK